MPRSRRQVVADLRTCLRDVRVPPHRPQALLQSGVRSAAPTPIEIRLRSAGFEETCRLEDFDWTASVTLDRRLLNAVFSLAAHYALDR